MLVQEMRGSARPHFNWNHGGRYDLPEMLEKGAGLVKIKNFLPTYVADGLLELVSGSMPARRPCRGQVLPKTSIYPVCFFHGAIVLPCRVHAESG